MNNAEFQLQRNSNLWSRSDVTSLLKVFSLFECQKRWMLTTKLLLFLLWWVKKLHENTWTFQRRMKVSQDVVVAVILWARNILFMWNMWCCGIKGVKVRVSLIVDARSSHLEMKSSKVGHVAPTSWPEIRTSGGVPAFRVSLECSVKVERFTRN